MFGRKLVPNDRSTIADYFRSKPGVGEYVREQMRTIDEDQIEPCFVYQFVTGSRKTSNSKFHTILS